MRRRPDQQTLDTAEQIRRLLEDLLELEALFTTRHVVVLRGVPRIPLADFEQTATARLAAAELRASIDTTQARGRPRGSVLITVHLGPAVSDARPPWLNIALFGATVATTILFGGPEFAAWFLAILLFHEFGHFIFARRHHIDASWPFFIPAPNILGTFGAFIQLRSPIRDRVALFDMAVAGPLAGFVVSVIALFVGLSQSIVVGPEDAEGGIILGESLLFQGIASLVIPGIGEEQNIMLHPVAFAGWAGLLVTMFNLLPMGQLDGGHIAYALWREKQHLIASVTIIGLAVITFWWPWWLLWIGIGLFMRLRHPPTLLDEIPITATRRLLGWVALIIFVLCFTPVPFTIRF